MWIAWIYEYILKDRSLWHIAETQSNNRCWKKLLKLRTLSQRFIEWKEDNEQWKFSNSGYRALEVWRDIRPKNEKVAQHRLIWTPFVVPKHVVIAWLAILNRLHTIERLRAWGMDMDVLCSLSKQEQESRDHLFFTCFFSK